jgi:PAS domain S-box-containing protein
VPGEAYETKLIAKDGRALDASITFSPVRDAEGRVIGCSKIIRDITERKRTEAHIAEHQAQLAAFVEQTPAAIGMFDTEMTYLAASRRFVSDHRAENVKLIGISHYEAFPEIPRRWRDIHARVLAGPLLRPDGRTDWFRWSMKPWRTPDGRIGGALLFTEVINEQVEARRALATGEERSRVTFESAPVGIAHVGPDGRRLSVNEALCRILGYPASELSTKTILDVTHPDDIASSAARFEQVLSGKIDHYDADKRYLSRGGATVWARLTVNCVRKRDGSMDYLVTVVEDISARKRAEAELADSEKRFRATFENVAVGITHVAPDGRFLRFNKALSRLLGWPADELITKSVQEITHRDDFEYELAEWERLRTGKVDSYSVEKRDLRRDGTIVWVRLTRSCVRKDDGSVDYFVAVVEDISARKQAEEELRKSEERFIHLSSTRRCQSSCSMTGSKSWPLAKAGSKKPAIRETNCAR